MPNLPDGDSYGQKQHLPPCNVPIVLGQVALGWSEMPYLPRES